MIEQIERLADRSQLSLTNDLHRQDLEAMADLELQQAFERLSREVEEQKREERPLVGMERLEWEAALLRIVYQRESIQYEQISRGIAHLEQCWTAARERQRAHVLEGTI